ncbi:MAG: SBBP repeat-containing protein [Ignavibacteriae bacterium]|nr:SBBP repeat-containing protein [Ignavibacteriota bacterium]
MKKLSFTVYVLLVLIICYVQVSAQVTADWVKTYNGNFLGSYAHNVALDGAGNVYVSGLGHDSITQDKDLVIIKYNPSGVFQWAQKYNGPGNQDEYGDYLAVDAAGNVYATCTSLGSGTGRDFATIKYNTNGVLQWVQRYNGTGNGNDNVYGIGVDNSGNVFVSGWGYGPIPGFSVSGMSFTTIKYSSTGAQQWVKKYNAPSNTLNPGNDYVYAMKVDNSGNVYVSGTSMGMGGYPYSFLQYCVTIKYNTFGDSVWVARYADPDSVSVSQVRPVAIAVNNAGYVFITGACAFNNTNGSDYFTLKYNSSGVYQWFKKYTGPGAAGSNTDQPSSIAVDNSNVYVTGSSKGSTTDYDYATVKYDFSGVQQWVQRYNGPGNGQDAAYSIKVDSLGNSYVTGISTRVTATGQTDFATIKYDYFGTQKWLMRFTGNLSEGCGGYSLALNSSGNVYVAGFQNMTCAAIKYSQQVGIENISSEIPGSYSLSQNYPNPFNPVTNIRFSVAKPGDVKISVYDMTGREAAVLVNENLNAGTYSVDWNAGGYTSGVYFYRMQAGNYSETKRMILIK